MSVVIGIACEDNGHFSTVTRLVDDTLVATHDWLDGILADCRSWRGLEDGDAWYKYDPDDANDLRPMMIAGQRIAPQGRIRGEPRRSPRLATPGASKASSNLHEIDQHIVPLFGFPQ